MVNSISPSTMTASDAQPGADGLTLAQYTNWLNEIQNQPAWRAQADKCMEYVAGNQLDAEILQKMRQIGMPPAIEPLVGPAIEAVIGLEAKTRTDWRVTPDGDKDGDDVAAALNFKLNQAERHSGADRACSGAFATQAPVGIGWVEVTRESDPFKFPYKATVVHRNEIFWDMLDREPGLPKARYLVRRRWTDTALVELMFPKHRDLIKRVNARWTDQYQLSMDGGTSTDLANSWEAEKNWSIEEQEWREAESGRVCLFEVWYRRWVAVNVMRTPDGRVVEVDMKNQVHIAALASGAAKPERVIVSKMYVSFWMGPHKLRDGPTPYPHQDFPYVQFIGKIEDRSGTPYGLVKPMLYLQDNVNSAISKIRWGLSAVRTTRTEGAVKMTDEQFRNQSSRVDADIILDAAHMAKPGAKFEVERDFQLTEQQYKMLADARAGIDRASGISNSFKGREGTATSGLQENTQIEQSTQALAGLMDNFKFARAKVGELLLALIVADMGTKPEKVLIRGNAVVPDREVALNIPTEDPDAGITYLTNDVQRTRLKVAVSDVPTTSSFRAQQLAAMSEAFKSMPQQYQIVALPHLLSLMDVPNKEEIIKDIMAAREEATPEQIQARIDEAVKLALQQSDHALRARELDLKYSPDKLLAEIDKLVSETVKNGVQSAFSAMQAGQVIATMPQVAPVADAVMVASGYRRPTPAGQDPDFPQPAGIAVPPPDVQTNTSPTMPPVPQQGTSPMDGIETARTSDNLVGA